MDYNETSMEKIVYLCPNGYIGGAERFVLEAAAGHLQYGQYRPTIVFFNDGPAVTEAKARQIPTYVLKNSFRLSRPLSVLKAVLELRKFFIKEGHNLYNATMPYAHIIGALAATSLSIKRTWYQHGPVGGLLDVMASFFKVDQVYFNSEYTRTQHFRHPIHTQAKFQDTLIPIGIPDKDTSDAKALREQYVSSTGLLLLTGGRITEAKGFENAIKAFQNILKRYPSLELKLLVIGEAPQKKDERYLESLKTLANKEIKSQKIHFLGRKDNFPSYMKAADIFLHTTKIPEAFGLVIAEAMKQNTLVIGTSQGGSSDILIDQKTGYSFDSTSARAAQDLTRILNKVIQTDNSLLIANAKELIDKKYSIKEMISNLEREFELILSSS